MSKTLEQASTDLPPHLEHHRVNGRIDLTRPGPPGMSDEDKLALLRAAIAEGVAAAEAGDVEDAEVVFAELQAELDAMRR